MMYFMISNPGMGRLSTVQVGVLEPNAFFLISRDGTIVQVGGVMEPNVFYDFKGWDNCPGGRCP